MITPELMINVFAILSISTVVVLTILLLGKVERLNQMEASNQRLKSSLDEMDEQAKLIVRTDMELNKIQEELDKKVTGLYALQSFSRAMSTTLEENQIFKILESGKLIDLGFEKSLAFLFNEADNTLATALCIGYSETEARNIEQQSSLLVQIYTRTAKEGKTWQAN